MEVKEKFSGKYLTKNFIIRRLVKNFFSDVNDIISNLDVEKVLEVGCGLGFSTQYLVRILKGADFQSSEYELSYVLEARRRNPGIKIIQESVYDLKREDNSFDLVIMLEVLEHLRKPQKALEELHRVTSHYCLLSVPNEPLWRFLNICRLKYLRHLGNTPGHLQHWSKKDLIRFLKPYFSVEEVKTPLPWIIVLVKKK